MPFSEEYGNYGLLPKELKQEDKNTIYDIEFWQKIGVWVESIEYFEKYQTQGLIDGERVVLRGFGAWTAGTCWTFAFVRPSGYLRWLFEMAWPSRPQIETNIVFTKDWLNQLESIESILNTGIPCKPLSKLKSEPKNFERKDFSEIHR